MIIMEVAMQHGIYHNSKKLEIMQGDASPPLQMIKTERAISYGIGNERIHKQGVEMQTV